jgi:hypothetical protein
MDSCLLFSSIWRRTGLIGRLEYLGGRKKMRDLNSSLVDRCAETSLFQETGQLAEKREVHATTRKLPIAPEGFAPDLQATSDKIQLLYKYEDGCGRC